MKNPGYSKLGSNSTLVLLSKLPNWSLMTLCALFCGVLFGLFGAASYNEFNSQVILQMGHYPCESSLRSEILCEIEPVSITRERIVSRSFHQNLVRLIDDKLHEKEYEKIFTKIKILELKSGNSLLVTAISNDEKLSAVYLKKLADAVVQLHADLLKPLLDNYKEQSEFTDRKIKFFENKLPLTREFYKDQEDKILLKRIIDFKIQPTKTIEDVSTNRNSFTELVLAYVEIGLLFGFFIGIFMSQILKRLPVNSVE